MGYRRLFIMRKDIGMSAGKLAAQVGHCAEAYWILMIRDNIDHQVNGLYRALVGKADYETNHILIDQDEYEQYINGSFVKTICEAKNKNHLLKAKTIADELGLVEGYDYGLIFDNCRTELKPEEENGTTLTGIWFKPLPDEVAHQISKKYQLYK